MGLTLRLPRKLFRVSVLPNSAGNGYSLVGPLGKVLLNFAGRSLVIPNSSVTFFSHPSALSLLLSIRKSSIGLEYGYYTRLTLNGVGFRVWVIGRILLFDLGFSAFHAYSLPLGISAAIGKASLLLVAADQMVLSTVADQLCSLRFPDSYKGKGILLGGSIPYLKKKKRDAK